MSLKLELYQLCESFIEKRFNTIQKSIEELQASLLSETKSSAGDKHETGRAMLQLEREKAGQQLAEIQKQSQLLDRIDISKSSKIIRPGSLVYTTNVNYFITVSAGELKQGEQSFYAISLHTPIAKLLLGKTIGDQIVFRDQEFIIKRVF